MKRGRRTRSTRSARERRAATRFAQLVRVMDLLRSDEGCPWDREQTHASLRPHLLEESYEAIDAIDKRQWPALAGELGDVLFQCVFHAQIAFEHGRFDIADAIDAITRKLIRRHPHVFTADGRPLSAAARNKANIRTPTAVKEQWEQIKAKEQAAAGDRKRVLTGIPTTMPALLRAHEIGRRVAAVGFDWSRPEDVVGKIEEEAHELRAALTESRAKSIEELGDLLFSLANLSRKLGIEPESALRAANDKFTRRFAKLEAEFERRGRSIHEASLEEMEAVWQQIKSAPRRARRSSATKQHEGS